MEIRSASVVLRDSIQNLEIRQAYEEQILREQFILTYEQLKPVNLLKSSFKNFISAPPMADNMIGTAMGLLTGYLSRKIVVGTSANVIRKLFGLLLQLGVTNTIEQHPDAIKSTGRIIFNYFLNKKRE